MATMRASAMERAWQTKRNGDANHQPVVLDLQNNRILGPWMQIRQAQSPERRTYVPGVSTSPISLLLSCVFTVVCAYYSCSDGRWWRWTWTNEEASGRLQRGLAECRYDRAPHRLYPAAALHAPSKHVFFILKFAKKLAYLIGIYLISVIHKNNL